MRHLIIAAITLTLLLPAALSGQRKGPRALVVESEFDFGYMPQHTSVSHTYWVNNLGTETLKIFSVRPGCGCTDVPLTIITAEPNDSIPIEVIFKSGRRSRKQKKGTKVACNDFANREFDLYIKAWVYKEDEPTGPIEVNNNQLKLTTDDAGKRFPITIKNVSEYELTTTLIDYPRELLTVMMPSEPIPTGGSAEILIKLKKNLEKKKYSKSFTFELSDSSQTRFTVPVALSIPVQNPKSGE